MSLLLDPRLKGLPGKPNGSAYPHARQPRVSRGRTPAPDSLPAPWPPLRNGAGCGRHAQSAALTQAARNHRRGRSAPCRCPTFPGEPPSASRRTLSAACIAATSARRNTLIAFAGLFPAHISLLPCSHCPPDIRWQSGVSRHPTQRRHMRTDSGTHLGGSSLLGASEPERTLRCQSGRTRRWQRISHRGPVTPFSGSRTAREATPGEGRRR